MSQQPTSLNLFLKMVLTTKQDLDARRQKRSETQGLATVRDYRYFCAQQTQY
jgi:hypothetical protein